jgi:phenylalanyl-tRNA synthetase beta chain
VPPTYRFDIRIEEDLVEEIARIVGFENIPAVPPMAAATMHLSPETSRSAHTVRAEMSLLGYQEVINFSFVEEQWEIDMANNEDPIRLLNPIASQLAVMRSTLLPGLIANIRYNANRKQSRARVFELGRIFKRDDSVIDGPLTVAGVHQPQYLAGAAWGPFVEEQWGIVGRHVDFYDVKHDVETLFASRAAELKFLKDTHPALHPGQSARILLGNHAIGWLGTMHPKWVQAQEFTNAPVMFEISLEALQAVPMPVVQELSRQPVVQRDMAVWVLADKPVGALLDTITTTIASHPELAVIRDVKLFDVWRDKSAVAQAEVAKEKSLAFRFWLQDTDVTLDDARVDACLLQIRNSLESAHQARQR